MVSSILKLLLLVAERLVKAKRSC